MNLEMPVALHHGLNGNSEPGRQVPPAAFFNDADYGESSKWISPFCLCSDWQTCFLSYLCPFYLCGKTHWRLKRAKQGEDALDSSWKCWYGCNAVCLGCCILSLISAVPGGLMLGYQQNRIRAFYNIGGDPVVDCLLPFLCATCVNARNDREIRVREGDMELRRKFIYTEKSQAVMDTAAVLPVRSAPPIIEPMRYVSPRQTSEHTSNHSFAAPPYTEDGQALHGDLNIEPQRPRFAFLKPQEHRREDGTDPQRESRARASVEEAEHAATRNQEPSFEGQHCGRSDNDIEQPVEHPAISPTINVETETQKINLLLEPQDSVARRVGFDTDTTDIPGRRSSEHSLTESEGRDTATSLRGKRSNIGSSGGGQLSYVHDFSDCPVNKSVLMYYEKEENKFKNPTLQDYTSSQLGSNNPYQRLLIHCHPNPDSSGNDTAADEYVRLPHRAVSSSRPTRTASSHYEGLEQSQDGSSKPPATRSAEDLGPTRLAYDPDSRADKKATSF